MRELGEALELLRSGVIFPSVDLDDFEFVYTNGDGRSIEQMSDEEWEAFIESGEEPYITVTEGRGGGPSSAGRVHEGAAGAGRRRLRLGRPEPSSPAPVGGKLADSLRAFSRQPCGGRSRQASPPSNGGPPSQNGRSNRRDDRPRPQDVGGGARRRGAQQVGKKSGGLQLRQQGTTHCIDVVLRGRPQRRRVQLKAQAEVADVCNGGGGTIQRGMVTERRVPS
ncbi:hypothetical protein [Micromonospora sp. KC213]|uniref:hypothetical protein n=1 Tax=Micromonospora sp. KC213 TaxID=2530378 RepID=UPI00104987EF|nr:hypothetical protein [Micromonospora sp. KC213]TDC43818.1 hypothetical protein E1166_02145 [Micromonospora sp. KC213]